MARQDGMGEMRPLITLDPTNEAFTRSTSQGNREIASAPRSLSGLRVGLLANGKRNGEELLDAICAQLERQSGVSIARVVKCRKAGINTPPEPEIMRTLVGETDIVITAIGD